MREPIRRVVTDHDGLGLAIFRSDASIALDEVPKYEVAAAVLWTTGAVPADNACDVEGERRETGMTLKGGSVLRVTDLAPGFVSPMHRSHSIDYAVVVSGSVELELDGGDTRLLRAGDIAVQRGTNHIWRNSGEDWCRVIFVMIEAEPLTFGQEMLAETVL